jgi:hypothetical protein
MNAAIIQFKPLSCLRIMADSPNRTFHDSWQYAILLPYSVRSNHDPNRDAWAAAGVLGQNMASGPSTTH